MDWKAKAEKIAAEQPKNAIEIDWDDLNYLHDLVLETKPMTILEYGSGYSTLAMYAALEELGRGVIHALESDPIFYFMNYQSFGPYMEFNHNRDFRQRQQGKITFSPVETVGMQECRYIFSPITSADFVYVDGPYLFGEMRAITNPYNLSPLPDTMVIDGRPAQMLYTHTRFTDFYDIDIDRENFRSTLRLKDGRPSRSSDTPGEPAAEA